jgi:hypothetical protein
VFCIRAVSSRDTRTLFHRLDSLADTCGIECLGCDFPRCTWDDLSSGQLVLANQTPHTRGTHAQALRGVLESEAVIARLTRVEGGKRVIGACRSDAKFSPRVSGTSWEPEAIERGGDRFVRVRAGHLSDDLDRLETRTPAVSPRLILFHAELGVSA